VFAKSSRARRRAQPDASGRKEAIAQCLVKLTAQWQLIQKSTCCECFAATGKLLQEAHKEIGLLVSEATLSKSALISLHPTFLPSLSSET
jgi:hypothetical protein